MSAVNPSTHKIKRQSILDCLAGRPAITRFAPSPTGFLHLGHLVNAIYVWGIARALGGRVILRMEDHDQTRVRPEYEKAILDDLAWLGLIPDEGNFSEFRSGRNDYRQSDAGEIYSSISKDLNRRGLLFACDCSRKSLRERSSPNATGEIAYDGFCQERNLPFENSTAWRLRLPQHERIDFNDLLLGPQSQIPKSQCGDVIIRDRNGNWTYQFAVVADDLRHNVNLIIRGMDILESTTRQLLIAEAMGKELNVCYLHHGLLMGPNGVKLSKKHFDKDIHERMLFGESAEDVLGEAAYLAGLITHKRPVNASELPKMVVE